MIIDGSISEMRPDGYVLADRLIDMTVRIGRCEHPVLEEQATIHGVSGIHILCDRVFHEALGNDDRHLARSHISLIDDTTDTAEMICMRMRMHDGRDCFAPRHVR